MKFPFYLFKNIIVHKTTRDSEILVLSQKYFVQKWTHRIEWNERFGWTYG
jgi:hypothetical protein